MGYRVTLKATIPHDASRGYLTPAQEAEVKRRLQNTKIQEYLQGLGWTHVDDIMNTVIDWYEV